MIYDPAKITITPILNMEFGRVTPPPQGYSEPNCYGYGLHLPVWMQPGSHGPIDLYDESEKSPEGLILALEADGLVRCERRRFDPSKEHILAATFGEHTGYHILRLDGNGLWSHQNGSGSPKDRDYSGQPIIDPEQANLGPYRFVSYFCVQEERIMAPIRYRGAQALF